jgi:hypothetical protein
VRKCSTLPAASHSPMLLQTDIEKPGPFAANVSEPGCGAATTTRPGPLPAARRLRQRSICSKRARNLMLPSGRSACASLSMPAGSISILPTSIGVPLRLAPMAGECSDARRCDSVDLPACCHCRYQSEGGSVQILQPFLNLSNENDFVLIVAWLLAALRPGGPYPLLAVSGEQGSAKTVLSKLLRALVDPNIAPVRALPREERELMIAANNDHLLAFDNLSGLPPWLSDALCRIASGGSFAVRQLYTDDEEVLFQAARPTVLNGIQDVVGRADLADRAIFLSLGPIGEEQRRSEAELCREFERARPAILGALLDATAHGLWAVDSVSCHQLPRMADFALWATACETALWPAGTFTRAYAPNRKDAIESIIDADSVVACVRELMSERGSWTGSAADLLRISVERSSQTGDSTGRIKNPRALAGHLRRAQTFLRALGVDITFSREGRAGTRVIRIRRSAENNVSTVSTVSRIRNCGSEPLQKNIA